MQGSLSKQIDGLRSIMAYYAPAINYRPDIYQGEQNT